MFGMQRKAKTHGNANLGRWNSSPHESMVEHAMGVMPEHNFRVGWVEWCKESVCLGGVNVCRRSCRFLQIPPPLSVFFIHCWCWCIVLEETVRHLLYRAVMTEQHIYNFLARLGQRWAYMPSQGSSPLCKVVFRHVNCYFIMKPMNPMRELLISK